MTIPKLAIEKAISGGWKTQDEDLRDVIDLDWADFYWQKAVLDPSFWQALGKSCGWLQEADERITPTKHEYSYKYYARRFYDLILTGGNTDAYWKELLN